MKAADQKKGARQILNDLFLRNPHRSKRYFRGLWDDLFELLLQQAEGDEKALGRLLTASSRHIQVLREKLKGIRTKDQLVLSLEYDGTEE